jgi:hypothetical protein
MRKWSVGIFLASALLVAIMLAPSAQATGGSQGGDSHHCQSGWVGVWPNCKHPCPTGWAGQYWPGCHPPCPKGWAGTSWPKCRPPCPKNWTGSYWPNCKPPKCPPGMVPPYCERPRHKRQMLISNRPPEIPDAR